MRTGHAGTVIGERRSGWDSASKLVCKAPWRSSWEWMRHGQKFGAATTRHDGNQGRTREEDEEEQRR